MFPMIDEVPTATSLLMQCCYRSKVCTNVRATKIDGSLHKLCELHRRKANANQQRLHQRQREARVKRRRAEASITAEERLAKKVCLSTPHLIDSVNIDPIPYTVPNLQVDVGVSALNKHYSHGFFTMELGSSTSVPTDMEMLELLLTDFQTLPTELKGEVQPASPLSVDDTNTIIV